MRVISCSRSAGIRDISRILYQAIIFLRDQYPEFKRYEQQHHSLFGLAPEGACQAAVITHMPGGLLHRHFNLTGSLRRYIFCCAFLPGKFLSGILRKKDFLPCGVRTFLTVTGAAAVTDPRIIKIHAKVKKSREKRDLFLILRWMRDIFFPAIQHF